MRKLLKRLGTALLFLTIALSLAPSLVPPFLDRIYYDGPASDHYDGNRFFNPGFQHVGRSRGSPARFFNRWARSERRAEWPRRVPVPPYRPSPATQLCPARSDGTERDVDAYIACELLKQSRDMYVTWVSHATVLVQTSGLNILTDPLWSERTSPFSFIGPRRVRPPGIPFERLPPIDLVLVSHNHYDHMDIETLRRLWQRDRPLVVTSLGNDTILGKAGIEARAADWGETVRELRPCAADYSSCDPPEIAVTIERVHHWSSRWGTDRNRALWSGFTVHLPGGNVFFAGDTGWGDGSWPHEAARRGPFRLAILPIGAYEPRDVMRGSHVDPEESVRIFEILNPATALGMHWGTVQLTFEAIGDPPRRLAELRRSRGIPAGRFVVTEVGRTFSVPALAAAR